MTQPVLNQQSTRGRLDDNNEVDATWVTAADTSWTQPVDTNFRVRFLVQETAGGMAQNTFLKLQSSLNNETWAQVSAQSLNVVLASSQNYAALSDTTQQIGAGTFITPNAGMGHSSAVSAVGGTDIDFQSNEVEVEWCLQVVSADVANLDNIQLRLLEQDTVLDTYTATANFVALHDEQDIEASLLTNVQILNDGLITLNIESSILTDADTLFHGEVAADVVADQDIEGTVLIDADTLNHGDIDLQLHGSILTDADDLFHGEFGFGAVDIEGSLLDTDADTLNDGLITNVISGSLLSDADTLFDGDVKPQQIFGSILEDADTLFHGEFGFGAVNIEGSVLTDSDTIFNGILAGNDQDIAGSILEESIAASTTTETFFIPGYGVIADAQDGDEVFIPGYGVVGNRAADAAISGDTFFDGDVAFGSLDQNIQGTALIDTDTLNHGLITLDIEGSLLTDTDTLNHGLITSVIHGSILTDADTLNHGQVNLIIHGSILEDADTLFHGEFGFGAVGIEGSLLKNKIISGNG